MKLSIIIPTYNKANCLDKLLLSPSIQNYDLSLVEIIVVNDGSTDNTQQIVEKYKPEFINFKYIKQNNVGIGAARNAGMALADCDLVCFFADDYIVDPNYCTHMIKIFDDETVMSVRADLGSVGNSAIEQVRLNDIRMNIWINLYGNQKLAYRNTPVNTP